mgnify:CR=1 FL=1
MNTLRISPLSLLMASLISASSLAQADPGTPSVQARPDHTAIAGRQAGGPTVNGTKLEARKPTLDRQLPAAGFLNRSTLLAFNGNWTLVPKTAVIHIPESLQSRIVTEPTGKLLPWREFFALNRGWLHTQNVALSDARGETELSPAVCLAYRATGRVVVAVHKRGPISMPVQKVAQK